jgi:uncharacterized membrane protein YiaA
MDSAILYVVFLGGAFVFAIGLYKVFRGLNLS